MRPDVSRHQIRHLCERKSDKQIEVKFFELPPVAKEVISSLHDVQESLTFQDIWTQYGKKAQTARKNGEGKIPHLSISEVVEHVWKPAFRVWNQHAASVMNGTISLGNVDKLFDRYKNREKDLKGELLRMFKLSQGQSDCNADKMLKITAERITQVQRYQQISRYASAADTIWQFKKAMGFSGNFKVINHLCNQVSKFYIFHLVSQILVKYLITLKIPPNDDFLAGVATFCCEYVARRCFEMKPFLCVVFIFLFPYSLP